MDPKVSVGGQGLSGPDRPPPTFPARRECAHEACGTRLSIYNDTRFCSLHAVRVVPRMRGRKAA